MLHSFLQVDRALPRFLLKYRRPFIVAVHVTLWVLVAAVSFALRYEFRVNPEMRGVLYRALPLLLVVRIGSAAYFGTFRGLWRYTGARDLTALLKATTLSTVLFVLGVHFLGPAGFPRSVFVIDWLATIVVLGGLRFSIRAVRELAASTQASTGRRKVLIAGAGDEGEALVREMLRNYAGRYEIVGFVDDNPVKQREQIHGVNVLGRIEDLGALVQTHEVQEVIVALASATGAEMRRIVDLSSKSGVVVRTIPPFSSILDGRVRISELRTVAIEDLLRREPISLDMAAMSDFLHGRVVLVTGAGGSIGSELCRQVAKFGPAKLVLVEQAENNLFEIHREIRAALPDVTLVPCIADVCDVARMDQIFAAQKPSVVLHAAAHKHVPMMEWNPGEAVKNNVLGSKGLADLAHAHEVERFVMISTDKAVNPTSVMGASKRAAEIYIQALSQRSSTRFVTVRFGNVLGSAGSVIPIFQEQIRKGGPVTVTHPEMKRYFMTIPEACQLVLQAGTMGKGGEIFVLDMGEPVKIVDLARDLITLSGLRVTEDIEIEFTGMRPGEKLFEELAIDGEHVDKTRHPKIFVGRFKPYAWDEVLDGVRALEAATGLADSDIEVRARLSELIPEYRPSEPVRPSRTSVTGAVPARSEAAPKRERERESTSNVVRIR